MWKQGVSAVSCDVFNFQTSRGKSQYSKLKELKMIDGIKWHVVTFSLDMRQSFKINLEMMDEFLLRKTHIVAYNLSTIINGSLNVHG